MLELFKSKLSNNRMLRNGFLSLLGTFLVRIVNLISVPVFSRLMSASDYGKTDVFMTYVNIFMILMGLDFHGAIARGIMEFEGEEDDYITSSLFFTTLASLGIFFVINILFSSLEQFFSMNRTIVNILLIYSYATFIISFRSAEYNFYYEYKKNMRMSLIVAMGNFFLSVFFIVFIFNNDKFEGRILGAAIPTIIVALIVYFSVIKRSGFVYKWKYIKFSLKFGLPLIPHNLSHMVLGSADKIMIEAMISATASGIYSLVYTIGFMISVLTEALNNVWVPWLFRELKNNHLKKINDTMMVYLLGYTAISVMVMTVAPEMVKFLASKEYWDGIEIVEWIIFATYIIFIYTIYVNVEFYYKKTIIISIGTIMAATINVVLNIMFLKQFGYQFAAMSTVLSYIALLFFHTFSTEIVLKKHIFNNYFIYSVSLAMFIFVKIIQVMLNSFMNRLLLCVLAEIIIGIVFLFVKRKQSNV